ncbi:MAG TPA: type II toxin-antitoxin system RelE/ParE family toxin [Gemmata sp.]|nr:type II toxin-antitoxin system RelE/ParE family toxin [Gemmata sp.]
MNVRILGVARAESLDVADAYDQLTPGLGQRFLEALDAFVAIVASQPRLYPRVRQRTGGREVREGLLTGFLFIVVYEVTPAEIVILSVTHGKRRTRPWRQRLTPPPAP